MHWTKQTIVSLAVLALACGQPVKNADYDFGDGSQNGDIEQTGVVTETDNDSNGEGGGNGTGSDEGSTDGNEEKFDVPEDDKWDLQGEITDDQCEMIDFLFVIDNSGSMADQQANLIATFPDFVDGILYAIPSLLDYRVGVITTDSYQHNIPLCQPLGGLVVQTGGPNSSDDICGPYANGKNFITINDDLLDKFECAAQVGTGGSSTELSLAALTNSLEFWLNSPGKCNHEFLRQDSLLVIIIITDEDDHSGGLASDWYEHLIWLKNDNAESFVVLTLTELPMGLCAGFGASDLLIDFTNKFPYGFLGDVCAPDYGDFFYESIGWIVTACGVFPQ